MPVRKKLKNVKGGVYFWGLKGRVGDCGWFT